MNKLHLFLQKLFDPEPMPWNGPDCHALIIRRWGGISPEYIFGEVGSMQFGTQRVRCIRTYTDALCHPDCPGLPVYSGDREFHPVRMQQLALIENTFDSMRHSGRIGQGDPHLWHLFRDFSGMVLELSPNADNLGTLLNMYQSRIWNELDHWYRREGRKL